jgi:hypothetical protein
MPMPHDATHAPTDARARPAHLCDAAFVFYLVFDTMKRLGGLVHDGVTIDTCDAYDTRLRVQRMGLTELGKRFAVNAEYLDEMVACITSVDALGRLKLVQGGLSRMVHAAMAAYMQDPIKLLTGWYVSVSVCTGRDGKKQFSSHHVIWRDHTFFGQCELVLSCRVC